jgi:hypothetical protein
MIAIRLPFLTLLLFVTTGLSAQQFGGNPPSLKWQQINTDTARIIFPAGLDYQARQVATIVQQLSRTTLPTIGGKQHKINIVLQNQTIIANGYVGLAPFRSEFQLTPEQNSFDLGSLPWNKMLAIHEYRHVQQYNNFRVGLSGAFYYLFGEGGQALANSLAIPNWFWEGDAVYQETLVSDQGRGRLPYFFNSYRSLWAGNKRYSWMKLRNGSLRDYVPSWYPLGYMMVAYGRQRYGDDFWKKVTLDAAAFRGLFYPMQRGITKYAGVSFYRFRRDALDYFNYPPATAGVGRQVDSSRAEKVRSPWKGGPRGGGSVDAPTGTSEGGFGDASGGTPAFADEFARSHKHFVADEEFPRFISQDSLLYMRSSYKRIPAFVVRDLRGGKDRILLTRAISLDTYFSYNAGKIVYAAYETDPRWNWRNYSVIRVLDPVTGKDTRITARSRYFSPDLSADGEHIITVKEATDGTCELDLLDSRTGTLEKSIPNKEGFFYTYPKFYSRDRVVSAVRNTRGEMSLALVSTGDGSAVLLLPFSFQTIGYPSVKEDTIWFTASRFGKDRIYGLAGGHLFAVRLPHGDPATGQYEFQSASGKYSWNTFTAVGFVLDTCDRARVQLEPLDPANWGQPIPTQGIDSLDRGPAHLLDRVVTADYPVSKYPASFHLINFHSWRPYINDPNYTFSLASENILNTLESELFFTYNRNEQYKQAGVDATYGALYPWLDGGWDYTFDRNALFGNQKIFWNETEERLGFSVPLSFTRHLSYTSLQFGSDLVYNQRYYRGLYKDSFNSKGFGYIDPFVNFSHQGQQAQQQIYPRFAQVLDLSYNRAVTTLTANQFLASGFLYLPGVAFTHSLLLAAAFQQRDTLQNARFSNNFPFSRGYTAENFHLMWRFSANYQLPLAYPDWGIGNVVYIQRIRTNLYYDYTKAMDYFTSGASFHGQFRSFGSEILFDTQWWNQLPVSFGIRYSRLLDPDFEGRGPNQWELILPLNLLSQNYSARTALRAID